jgi:TRAP-type uncharacterized transport system fused permease subunit
MSDSSTAKMSESELQDLVIESDMGARKPSGFPSVILIALALLWSFFQLWIASPIPYSNFVVQVLKIPVIDSTYSRYIHLAFALSLAFISYPATKKSPRLYIPLLDWVFLILSVIALLYLLINSDAIADRAGMPDVLDIGVSVVGVLLLMEAARRAMGLPMVLIAAILLFYTFAGSMPFMPDVIAHKSQSLSKVASHQWLSTEGVFGVALGVSTDFVFLYVLFGSLLERAGAGNYFIKLAFSLLGHLRGGAAKAAVLASAMTGMISGSSIANVVTTGTFTIPLMIRSGFSRDQAGAIESAVGVDGQIMPPVMGAAAFLMVEYLGVPYSEIIRAAFLPAVMSYIGLLYIVHLEALKLGIEPIVRTKKKKLLHNLLLAGISISSILILVGMIYYGVSWIKDVFTDNASYVIVGVISVAYCILVWFSSKSPDLALDDPNARMIELPETWVTLKTGLHYVMPLVVLVWCLMVENLSPGLSAFWATLCMIVLLLTQRPMKALFRKDNIVKQELKRGRDELFDGLIVGARNMIGVAIATATAGIIVGAISMTGIGQVMTEFVEAISGGSFILVLIFTALVCLVLGTGLPTTASYIVVASLMASVIVELGKKNGIIVPLIAVHLFVFYFSILADITPPVGLATFAAAAISGGDFIKTGWISFIYSMRTIILPFIFVYNTEMLLIGVDNWVQGVIVFVKYTLAILVFAAATQGYFIIKNKLHESAVLLLVTLGLFRPMIFVNTITPPYINETPWGINTVIENMQSGQALKLDVSGINDIGDPKKFITYIDKKEGVSAEETLKTFGLKLEQNEGKIVVKDVAMNSKAEEAGFDVDFEISQIGVPQKQISRNWIYLCALVALMGIAFLQNSRKSEIMLLKN